MKSKKLNYKIQKLYNLKFEDNLSSFVLNLFKDQKIEPKHINCHNTRFAYDNSDFTSFVLIYENRVDLMKKNKNKLNSILYKEKPIFSVSGNGWGTGLSVTLNIIDL